MEPKRIHHDMASTPTTTRKPFMRNRRLSTPHMISFLRKEGIAKELAEFENYDDEQHETSFSSMEADTSVGSNQMTSDDSGIDVSQNNRPPSEPSHFLRKRKKIAY